MCCASSSVERRIFCRCRTSVICSAPKAAPRRKWRNVSTNDAVRYPAYQAEIGARHPRAMMPFVVLAFDLYGVSGFEAEQLVRSAPLERLNDVAVRPWRRRGRAAVNNASRVTVSIVLPFTNLVIGTSLVRRPGDPGMPR
jgi:hypothetical protein